MVLCSPLDNSLRERQKVLMTSAAHRAEVAVLNYGILVVHAGKNSLAAEGGCEVSMPPIPSRHGLLRLQGKLAERGRRHRQVLPQRQCFVSTHLQEPAMQRLQRRADLDGAIVDAQRRPPCAAVELPRHLHLPVRPSFS